MNKAFTKEDDGQDAGYCPSCGQFGVPVGEPTIQAHVPPEHRRRLGKTVYWCDHPDCPVAYFDNFDARVDVPMLDRKVYPKAPDAPLCPCFALTYDDIAADVEEGVPTRIRELYRRSQTGEAHCITAAPGGRCCLPAVQKLYFQLRGGP
jgi:hypothetical protein